MRAGPGLKYWSASNGTVCAIPPISVSTSPRRTVHVRPPGRCRASSTSHS